MSADESNCPLPKTQIIASALPPGVEPVPVKCDGFRCLAYQDKKGTWRHWITRRELTGEVQPLAKKG